MESEVLRDRPGVSDAMGVRGEEEGGSSVLEVGFEEGADMGRPSGEQEGQEGQRCCWACTGVPGVRTQAGGQGARQGKSEWREFSQQTPLSIHKVPSAVKGLQQRKDWYMKSEDLMTAYAIDLLVADVPGDGQGRTQPGSLFCWGSTCHTVQQV